MYLKARRVGVDLKIWEGPIRRTYRPLSAQWLAWNSLPRGQAAYPGTSNHGWGKAVDLMNWSQRRFIDRYGAPYGWQKRWSDAQHEWWHIKWAGFGIRAKGEIYLPTIRKGTKNIKAITHLQRLLRSLNITTVTNGRYGIWTRRAVRRFQKKHGLKADGVVGPKTWKLLYQKTGNKLRHRPGTLI